ncbi:MAG TPA: hypothetical protein PKH07_11255, partial [bacterium]|nr:hypothetical protein [bacterium]
MLLSARMLGKLQGIEERYAQLRYQKVAEIPMEFCDTNDYLVCEPVSMKWRRAKPGDLWGKPWTTRWFRGDFQIPVGYKGKKVFIHANVGSHDTLFFVDSAPWGVFDENHPVVLLTKSGVVGKSYHLALEGYSGHSYPGAHPHDNPRPMQPNSRTFSGVEAMLEREDVSAFVFDFRVLRQLQNALDSNSLRKHEIIKCLSKVFEIVDSIPNETDESDWRPKLAEARKAMRPLLECRNGSTTPWFGVIGHSHLYTAWLWPLREARRKAARTFSSVLNLMEQYPEMLFVQNVPCHSDMIAEDYPLLFKRVQSQVRKGRWEPNGPMWV